MGENTNKTEQKNELPEATKNDPEVQKIIEDLKKSLKKNIDKDGKGREASEIASVQAEDNKVHQ